MVAHPFSTLHPLTKVYRALEGLRKGMNTKLDVRFSFKLLQTGQNILTIRDQKAVRSVQDNIKGQRGRVHGIQLKK